MGKLSGNGQLINSTLKSNPYIFMWINFIFDMDEMHMIRYMQNMFEHRN